MKEGSPQHQLIRKMFQFLLEMFNERQRDPLTALPAERMFSTLQFQVDHYCWYFTNNDNTISMEEYSIDRAGARPATASCSITTDAATMLKICRREMSFPNAYLSRKLKLQGDQNVLKSIGVPMKDALDALKNMKFEPEISAPPATNSRATPTSPADARALTAKIVEAFAPNFHYNIEDKFSPKAGHKIAKDVAVRYKIEVSCTASDETWTVSHRYSHFLNLRSELLEQGYRSIPVINAKNSLFNSFERVVQSRIIHLGVFINECIAQLGTRSDSLNQFLAKPLSSEGQNKPPLHTVHGADNPLRDNLGPHQQHQPLRPQDDEEIDALFASNRTNGANKHHREALEHAWSTPITWAKENLNHSRFLIKELAAQRKTLDTIHKENSLHASNQIATFLNSLRGWSLVLACGVISAYFYERAHIEHGLNANIYVEAIVKLSLIKLLLLFKSTRYQCIFYCVCWLIAINALVVSFTSANEAVNRYTEHWTMYKSHLKWLTIKHSVVMVPEHFRLPPSVTNILKETLPAAMHAIVVGGFHTVVAAGKSVFAVPTSLYDAAASLMLTPPENQLATAVSMVAQVDPVVCAMVAGSVTIAFVLSSVRLLRVLWIYLLGVTLISVYASLQIASYLLRLSPTTSEALFSRFDAVVAPFVVQQIGLLRSVFVKFAQYFGGRSDVVSPTWTALLSQLQDACPSSSHEYVRRIVEAQLGEVMSNLQAEETPNSTDAADAGARQTKKVPFKVEDLFENFEMTPIASASIGQVHTATIKHSALMKILHYQQRAEAQKARKDRASGDGTEDEGDTESGSGSRTYSGDDPPTPIPAPRILSPSSTPLSGRRGKSGAQETADNNCWYEPNTDPSFVSYASSEASQLVSVVVKVQHENIEPMMIADMAIVLVLIKWASMIDSRWVTMLQVMRNWDLTMRGELDYRQEAANLREMREIMGESGLGAATPQPVPGLESQRVLVMTRLFGYKVTDKPALLLNNVDREALLSRIAHCSAYQLLVAGVFNADPHAGNILFCLSTKDQRPSHILDSQVSAGHTARGGLSSAGLRSSERSSVGSQLSILGEEDAAAQRLPSGPLSAELSVQSERSDGPASAASRSSIAATSGASGAVSNTAGSPVGAASEVDDDLHGVAANGYVRHIYDATPAKGVSFKQAAVNAPQQNPENPVQTVPVLPVQRRMIYDATPAKNVGFAAELSPHSAVSYSTQAVTTADAVPTAAGHTPYPSSAMSGLTNSNGASNSSVPAKRLAPASPGSSIGLSTAFRQLGPSAHNMSFASLPSESTGSADIIPGLLDFGMTVRLAPERRRTYCRLIIALCDGDMKTAAAELKAVGYSSNQSDRAPERDAEFFEHIFRDANPGGASKQERDEFNAKRVRQKQDDIAAGTREKGGRSIANVPDDFLFLTRLIGLLRGLTSELDCSCPILYILCLNARIGLEREV